MWKVAKTKAKFTLLYGLVNFLDLYLCHWNDSLLWIKRQQVSYLIKLQKFYRRSHGNSTRFNGAKFIVYIYFRCRANLFCQLAWQINIWGYDVKWMLPLAYYLNWNWSVLWKYDFKLNCKNCSILECVLKKKNTIWKM